MVRGAIDGARHKVTGTIPIRNLYYFYAYAWDQFHFVRRVETGEGEGPNAPAFFAKILVQACHQIFRRGVVREYEFYELELSQLRGRIDVFKTFRFDTLKRGRVCCRFDELTANALQNQLIKATLIHLLEQTQLSPRLASDIRKCIRTFEALGVKTAELDKWAFRRAELTRKNSLYSFLLHICDLICEGLFPEHDGKSGQFASLMEDETKMNRIFERFIRNFFRHEQNEFEVRSEKIAWDMDELNKAGLELLPSMHTDASLRSSMRTIIIDTKYYSETLHTYYDRKALRSGHLYQLFAYVKNLENRGGPDQYAEGLLLYPTVHDHVQFETTIQGHRMRARTIDLNQPWENISKQLLAMTASAGQA
jgi:5-methylcytosine-specific restriction enzyme subunit McrC